MSGSRIDAADDCDASFYRNWSGHPIYGVQRAGWFQEKDSIRFDKTSGDCVRIYEIIQRAWRQRRYDNRIRGVLIEHFAGAFPVWLSPVQVQVMPISEKHLAYGQELVAALRQQDVRAELDARNEKIGLKIREAQLAKVPYMLVAGDKEVATRTVSLRTRKQGDQGSLPFEDVLARIRAAIGSREAEG